jgi:glycine oxidase
VTKDKAQISDVLIIGGGVIGLALARELYKKGLRRITLLDRGKIGKEASFAAAGMLAPQAESDAPDKFLRFCSESNRLYPQFAEELFDETGVDIELDSSGTLYLAFTDEDAGDIRRRFEWQKNARLNVEHLTALETRKAEPFVSPDVLESLFFPNDRQVENRKLLYALQKFAEINGIEIRENTEVGNLLTENGKTIIAETVDEKFAAEKVVLTTGAWTSLIKTDEFILPQIKPIRGQMISFSSVKRMFSKVIYSPRGYLVPRADGRILAGATVEDAGFDKSVSAEGIAFLRDHALEIAPSLVNLEIRESWANLRPFAADGLPVLGALTTSENLFIATAHYRNGILLAPLTAKIMADKIAENKDSDHLGSFGPHRFRIDNLRALKTTV